MKEMLTTWDKQFPGRVETIFSSLKNISPSQMADTKLFDFVNLKIDKAEASEDLSTMSEDAGLEILER
jgi:tRNA 2-thiocytidine biosynthesis protein TtcA